MTKIFDPHINNDQLNSCKITLIKKSLLFFCLSIFLTAPHLFSQPEISQPDELNPLAKMLFENRPDSVKFQINGRVEDLIHAHLAHTNSVAGLFDTLSFLKSLISENGKFRIVTWAFPVSNGSFHYSGVVQVFGNRGSKDTLIRLHHKMGEDDLFKTFVPSEWPGAVYYDLIERKYRQSTTYTLLGWMGAETGKAKRVVEILDLDNEDQVRFGAPKFMMGPGETQSRVVFEYTDQVPFHLKYENHSKPGKKRKKEDMIVFNRLVGNNPQMGRMYKAKIPDYSTFDGLIFEKGKWLLYRDLDLRMGTD
ncbi:MAG: hypothetical protein B6D64_07790 [Bacteroidetes bacterium 4484_276]|nr:MAG: hypothetical protein B6D64_07790 [Bacteroidetes bacterium 4484_276]